MRESLTLRLVRGRARQVAAIMEARGRRMRGALQFQTRGEAIFGRHRHIIALAFSAAACRICATIFSRFLFD